jgi:hypothetical protein
MFENDITIFEREFFLNRFVLKNTIRFVKYVYAGTIFAYDGSLLGVWYLSEMFHDGFKRKAWFG